MPYFTYLCKIIKYVIKYVKFASSSLGGHAITNTIQRARAKTTTTTPRESLVGSEYKSTQAIVKSRGQN